MAIIYTHVVDTINNRRFKLQNVVNSYTPMHDYFLENNSIGPIHQPMNNEAGVGNYTLAQMIDMYESGVMFTLSHPKDLFDIVSIMTCYLEYISDSEFDMEYKSKIKACTELKNYFSKNLEKASIMSGTKFDKTKHDRNLHLKRLGVL